MPPTSCGPLGPSRHIARPGRDELEVGQLVRFRPFGGAPEIDLGFIQDITVTVPAMVRLWNGDCCCWTSIPNIIEVLL
jgi:hypothetical protein